MPLEQEDVLLTDFENTTGDTVFDETLKEAFVLELEQSPHVAVVTDRKLKETLQLIGRADNQHITAGTRRELCARTGAKVVLGGKISSADGRYVLNLTAIDCTSGRTLAEDGGETATQKEILAVLSRGSCRLRAKLGEPRRSVQKFCFPIELTTGSLKALKNYSIGQEMRREQGDPQSIPFLKRAIELDPEFPLPFAALSAAYNNLREPTLALEYATKAYRLRARVNEREKLRIAAAYFLTTGAVGREIQTNKRWIVNYPWDSMPHNNLGNDYAALGQLDKALSEYKEALRLSPTTAGYANVMGMQLNLNRFTDAAATFDEAVARKLDGRYVHQTAYWLAFVRKDAALMEQQLAWASGKPGDEDSLMSVHSDTEAYYGRQSNARTLTEQASTSAIRNGSKETAALWLVNAALRESEVGNADLAERDVASALGLSSGRDVRIIAAFTLARLGLDTRSAPLVRQLEQDYSTDTTLKIYWLPLIHAAVALNHNNYSEALRQLDAAKPYELGGAGSFINYLYPAYLRGQAYLMAGDAGHAIAEFKKLLDHDGIVVNFVTGALSRLEIGRARAVEAEMAGAKEDYQKFFALWKDADADTPILKQAEKEYAKLH